MRPRCLVCLLLPALLLTASCARRYQGSDETEKEHPTLKQARELVKTQDLDGAEELLTTFLRQHPDFALTHLQLAMLYQTRNQSVPALYHYQAYLDARPDSRNARVLRQGNVVEQEIRLLAAQIDRENRLATPEGAAEESLRLRLAEAEQKVAEMEVKLQQAELRGGQASTQPPPDWARERLRLLEEIRGLRETGSGQTRESALAVQTVSTPEPARTYTVERGDTLSSIAQKMYGRASAWPKIYEANRDLIPNKNVLSRGVELKIP